MVALALLFAVFRLILERIMIPKEKQALQNLVAGRKSERRLLQTRARFVNALKIDRDMNGGGASVVGPQVWLYSPGMLPHDIFKQWKKKDDESPRAGIIFVTLDGLDSWLLLSFLFCSMSACVN